MEHEQKSPLLGKGRCKCHDDEREYLSFVNSVADAYAIGFAEAAIMNGFCQQVVADIAVLTAMKIVALTENNSDNNPDSQLAITQRIKDRMIMWVEKARQFNNGGTTQ